YSRSEVLRSQAEIVDKRPVSPPLVHFLPDPQQRRRMERDERFGAVIKRQRYSARLADRDRTAEQTSRGRRTKRDDDSGLHHCALQILPPAAAVDLVSVGPLVQ